MCRNKALRTAIALTLALMMTAACAESPNLIPQERITSVEANYRSVTVEPGLFVKEYSSGADEYYPYVYNLRFDSEGARFVEFLVGTGDEVRAGDVLAVFTTDVDEAALTELRLELQRAEDALAQGVREREEALEDLRGELLRATDRIAYERAGLYIERAEIELAQFVYRQECAIGAIRREIAEIEEEARKTELLSPVDGTVRSVARKKEGQQVFPGEVLVTVMRMDTVLLKISNDYGYFTYGMDVTVLTGRLNERVELPGEVVAVDTMLPEAEQSGDAYVMILPYEGEEVRNINPVVSAEAIYLENVLTVPKQHLGLSGGKHYVLKLVDGRVHKRFINCLTVGSDPPLVLQGLEAGEVIVVD